MPWRGASARRLAALHDVPMSALRYRFDDYELDAPARELRTARGPVALPPKSFDCLVYLLERRERAVGRDELISAVWGRVDVSDALLGQTLARARRAVGDTGEEQRVIRTVARFGYHWVAPVEIVGNDAVPGAVAAGPIEQIEQAAERAVPGPGAARAPDAVARRRPRAFTGVVLLLATIVVVAVVAFIRRTNAPAPPDAPAAAHASAPGAESDAPVAATWLVLPVDVAGEDASSRWIRFGAMDYLVSRLRERAGVTALPTEQAIALLARAGAGVAADPAQRLAFAAGVGASTVAATRMRRGDDGWTAELEVQDAERSLRDSATAATPLEAIDLVLARHFGLDPAHDAALQPPLLELQQRIDAAFLEGDMRAASELVESAPPGLRSEPAIAVRAAEIDERSGRLPLAERGFEALAAGGDTLPAALRARAAYGLCAIAYRRNELGRAQAHCDAALAALDGLDEPLLLGRAWMLRGTIEDESGRYDDALASFGLARIAWRRAGNLPGEASVDNNEGMAHAWHGHFDQAIAAFDRAAATFERFGVQDHLASTLAAKADAQRAMLDFDGSLASSERAWRLTPRMDDARAVRSIAFTRALTLIASGDLDATLRLVERYDDGRAGAPPEFAVLRRALASAQGDAAGAVADADALLERVVKPVDPTTDASPAWAAGVLIDAALAARENALAARLLTRLRGAGDAAADADFAYALDLAEARVADAHGDTASAEHRYAAAFARAVEAHRPDRTVVAGSAYARFLLRAGRNGDAQRIAGRFAVYADRDADAADAMIELYQRLGDDESLRRARQRRAGVHARIAVASG
jgi:DNA-binding winged helix-turn-helix (wHTH) protein/tetratricopeptide (TPR) repeat protein